MKFATIIFPAGVWRVAIHTLRTSYKNLVLLASDNTQAAVVKHCVGVRGPFWGIYGGGGGDKCPVAAGG